MRMGGALCTTQTPLLAQYLRTIGFCSRSSTYPAAPRTQPSNVSGRETAMDVGCWSLQQAVASDSASPPVRCRTPPPPRKAKNESNGGCASVQSSLFLPSYPPPHNSLSALAFAPLCLHRAVGPHCSYTRRVLHSSTFHPPHTPHISPPPSPPHTRHPYIQTNQTHITEVPKLTRIFRVVTCLKQTISKTLSLTVPRSLSLSLSLSLPGASFLPPVTHAVCSACLCVILPPMRRCFPYFHFVLCCVFSLSLSLSPSCLRPDEARGFLSLLLSHRPPFSLNGARRRILHRRRISTAGRTENTQNNNAERRATQLPLCNFFYDFAALASFPLFVPSLVVSCSRQNTTRITRTRDLHPPPISPPPPSPSSSHLNASLFPQQKKTKDNFPPVLPEPEKMKKK